jgi:adenylate kinase
MKNILMMGPQGSGKGTQSDILAAQLGIPHLSVGTLFRLEIASGSELGQEMKAYMDRGEIVPTAVGGKVIEARIARPDAANGLLFDGYPRTAEQLDVLDGIMARLGRSITHVIHLNISDDEAIRRISGRRTCSNAACERIYHVESNPPKKDPAACDACGAVVIQRSDDVPDAIRRRLQIYHAETFPLVARYAERGLVHEIDGPCTIDEVTEKILGIVGA